MLQPSPVAPIRDKAVFLCHLCPYLCLVSDILFPVDVYCLCEADTQVEACAPQPVVSCWPYVCALHPGLRLGTDGFPILQP